MKTKKVPSSWSFLLLLGVIVLCLAYLWRSAEPAEELQYSQVVQMFQQGQVEKFTVSDDTLTMYLRGSGEPRVYELYDFSLFYQDLNELVRRQAQEGIITSYDYYADHSTNWVALLLPYLLVAVVLAAVWYFVLSRAGGAGQDKMNKFSELHPRSPREQERKVTFADVAGADEEKAELEEIVEFLKDPEKYSSLGARIPKGVLLVGPPGTGKTLLAKAVAGEAGVGFRSISGSDFVEMYVGVGARRVRDLFKEAAETAPCIVFIDEIDAVGRQRGTGVGGGHDEREQTLNQLLVEMDGFSANEGVVVLAATNRADVLDPALLRPGRFDRQVYVGRPDIKGREEILAIHARNKPLADDVDLEELAKSTGGFTGADLENLMNEGALLAARRNEPYLTMDDLRDAVIKVIAGPEKKSRVVVQRERRLTAYHEAGHALVMQFLETQDPVHQISIVPRGQAGGMTISLPREDKSFQSRTELTERIAALLGGRVAEQMALGDISTGAGNDLQRATEIARNMVMRFGMSDRLGGVVFDSGRDEVFLGRSMGQTRGFSEEMAARIDEEVKALVDGGMRRCREILTAHRNQLEVVSAYLLQYETMAAGVFQQILAETAPILPTA